jgi:hypothetical protein
MAEHRSFKPVDGKETREFEQAWCDNCARISRPERCWIRFCGTMLDPADTDYPHEWRIGEDGPECAAFEPKARRVG